MFRTVSLALGKCFIPYFSEIAQNVSYPFEKMMFLCKYFIPPKIKTVKRLKKKSVEEIRDQTPSCDPSAAGTCGGEVKLTKKVFHTPMLKIKHLKFSYPLFS